MKQYLEKTGLQKTMKLIKDDMLAKTDLTVDSEGTSTEEVKYLTIKGKQYKMPEGGSGEPEEYIKSASVSGNTLTLTNKDDTTIKFTPQGGGSSEGGDYVPLTGGTMTGTLRIKIPEEELYTSSAISGSSEGDEDGMLIISGGPNVMAGASLMLGGKESYEIDLYSMNAEDPVDDFPKYYQWTFNDDGRIRIHTNDPEKEDLGTGTVLTTWNTYVPDEGTSTTELKYLTINGDEYKIPSGGGGGGGDDYLPLAGGTMKDAATITFQGTSVNTAINVNNLTSQLKIAAGPCDTMSNQASSLTLEGPSSGGRVMVEALTDYYNKAFLTINPTGEIIEDISVGGSSTECNILTSANTKASSTGTSTTQLKYLVIDGTEYKVAGDDIGHKYMHNIYFIGNWNDVGYFSVITSDSTSYSGKSTSDIDFLTALNSNGHIVASGRIWNTSTSHEIKLTMIRVYSTGEVHASGWDVTDNTFVDDFVISYLNVSLDTMVQIC